MLLDKMSLIRTSQRLPGEAKLKQYYLNIIKIFLLLIGRASNLTHMVDTSMALVDWEVWEVWEVLVEDWEG